MRKSRESITQQRVEEGGRMESRRILICHSALDRSLVRELRTQGYEIETGDCRPEARGGIREWSPDLVLLELEIPAEGAGSWDFLRWLQEQPNPPAVLGFPQFNRLDDRVRALDSGADDLIDKDYQREEILARIRALLRRGRASAVRRRLIVDDERKEVRLGDRRVTLSPKEYALLSLLSSARGRVFSSDEIVKALWNKPDSYAMAQDAQKYVYLLRRKIEEDPAEPRLVLTVRGFGYRLAV
jgi:two-component system KDP operon response regulator KdpE